MIRPRALLLITLCLLPTRGATQQDPSPDPTGYGTAPALAPQIAPPAAPRRPASTPAPLVLAPPAPEAASAPRPAPPQAPAPAPACTPRCPGVCGDDGCGGSCGACPDGVACDPAGRCQGCLSGREPTFVVHEKRRFRCLPDPVRGGHYCDAGSPESEYVDADACVRACRGASATCPGGGPAAMACSRCTARCAEARAVPCSAANGGTPTGTTCALRAGVFGLEAAGVVQTTCPGPRQQ